MTAWAHDLLCRLRRCHVLAVPCFKMEPKVALVLLNVSQ